MNPGGVRNVGLRENRTGVMDLVGMASDRCIQQHAPVAALAVRCLSNPGKIDLSIVVLAFQHRSKINE